MYLLNGVQEVTGSNPLAPTFKACRNNKLRQAFFIGLVSKNPSRAGFGQGSGPKRLINRLRLHDRQFEYQLLQQVHLFHKT